MSTTPQTILDALGKVEAKMASRPHNPEQDRLDAIRRNSCYRANKAVQL